MLMNLLDGLPYFPNLMSGWNLTDQQMMIIALFSGCSSYVMVRVASGVKVITAPVSFCACFFAAMFANWFFKDFHIHAISTIQKTMIFTIVGHMVATIALLFSFRSEHFK
jgi:hypothetical protein